MLQHSHANISKTASSLESRLRTQAARMSKLQKQADDAAFAKFRRSKHAKHANMIALRSRIFGDKWDRPAQLARGGNPKEPSFRSWGTWRLLDTIEQMQPQD